MFAGRYSASMMCRLLVAQEQFRMHTQCYFVFLSIAHLDRLLVMKLHMGSRSPTLVGSCCNHYLKVMSLSHVGKLRGYIPEA
jgi:hypothetical protein